MQSPDEKMIFFKKINLRESDFGSNGTEPLERIEFRASADPYRQYVQALRFPSD